MGENKKAGARSGSNASVPVTAVLLGLTTVLFGCPQAAVQPNVMRGPLAPVSDGAPDWVRKPGGPMKGEKNKLFAVGIASGIRNRAMAMDTADNRARGKLAEMFKTCVSRLARDYQASTTAGTMEASSEEQHVEQIQKTFTSMELSGTYIADHWVDPQSGDVYAMAVWDTEGFQKMIDQAKALPDKVRDFVRQNAQKSFERLDAEEAKHQGATELK